MRTILVSLVCAACVLSLAGPVQAQTLVLNPQTVEFDPSADHALMEADGTTPVVQRYELRMYLESAPDEPLTIADLGKPSPVAGKITITNPLWFAALTPRTRYVAKVAAIGTGGAGVSLSSNPFSRTSPPAQTPPPVIR